jgi:hypothetical protein
MFVSVRYDRGEGWIVDENLAMIIPELREVITDTSLGVEAIAYIALGADPASQLAETFDNPKEQLSEAAKCVYENEKKRESVVKDAKVKKAITKYQVLSTTGIVKIRQQFQGGVKKLGKLIEENGTELNLNNSKEFIEALGKLNPLIDAYSKMNEGKKEDVQSKQGKVRGDKQLGYRAIKSRKKK